MDASVLQSMVRWPGVPDVYGWLALDRRGNWLMRGHAEGRFARIGNAALREFIGRNYGRDARGCWYFQNGPQRVFVSLAYTPLVLRLEGESLVDHCGRPARAQATLRDDEGSVLLLVERGVGLLDDRDLLRFAEKHGAATDRWPAVARGDVQTRFGFVAEPPEKAPDSLR